MMSDLELIKQIEQRIGKPLKARDFMQWEQNDYILNQQQQLISLNLDGCGLNDISFLTQFISLQELSLNNNQITDFRILKNLKNLHHLYLGSNKIVKLTTLQYLKNLTILNLNSNKIKDITSLKELKNLNVLNLSDNEQRKSRVEVAKVLGWFGNVDVFERYHNQFDEDCIRHLIVGDERN